MARPVKIGNEIYDKIKELAEKQNKSMREIIEKAVTLYLHGYESNVIDKEIKGIIAKPIITKFKARCYKCKREIQEGELAYFIKITYTDNTSRSWLLHYSCYVEQFDESLAKAVIKREKIKAEIRSLEKYRSKLIDSITNEIEYIDEKLKRIHQELEKIHGFDEYYELYSILEDVKNLMVDIKQFIIDREPVTEKHKLKTGTRLNRRYNY